MTFCEDKKVEARMKNDSRTPTLSATDVFLKIINPESID